MKIDPIQEKFYNVRAAIPDHMDIFVNWRRWSDAYKAERPDASLDLAYGPGAAETLDFFPARNGNSDAPLVLLIHGGYWQAMDKQDNSFAARGLCDAGCAVAVVNYTLCPETSLDGIVAEMRRAALWLWRNERGLPFDPEQIYVIGHSAGGHLAAMMLCTDWRSYDRQALQTLFKGAVSISGLFDLSALVETTINEKVGLSPQSARELSPIHHVPHSGTPFIAAVGENESTGFHDQVDMLQKAWSPHGVDVGYMSLANRHHLGAFEALADHNSALLKAALALMEIESSNP